jgi:plastocyanin
LPFEINVAIGATVSWINNDSAAHTVTAGSPTDVQMEIFDSSLFMSGSVFEFTFDEAGSYDYFCMVHPWMTGKVLVN